MYVKKKEEEKRKREAVSIFGSCLIMPVAVTHLGLSQRKWLSKSLQFLCATTKWNKLLYVYMVLGWICAALGAVSSAVKSLSVMHSKGDTHSLSWMKVTLDSRLSLPVALPPKGGGGAEKTREIVTSINTGLPFGEDADCATRTDCSINKWLCFF